jgi:putative ABC transport system substrate-binding protein
MTTVQCGRLPSDDRFSALGLAMRRREFVTLLGAAATAWPLAARAQTDNAPRIGILSPLSPSEIASPPFEAFRRGLLDAGYAEGKSINFVYRWADGSRERLAAFAAELASLKVDVIFSAPGTPTAIATQKATTTIPIVFAGVGDAVGSRLVATLARPGGNATGLVNQSQDIAGKQLAFLKEAIPGLSRAGVLWRPSNPSYRDLLSRFEDVVRATGVQVVLIDAESRDDLVTAFEKIKSSQLDGLVVQADDLFINEGTRIIELAATHRVPAIYRLGYQAQAGGLMAYGPNIPDMYRRAAAYVDRILKGAKPGELPVEQPTKIELVINLKTAKTLGVTVPLTLQVAADEVIE